MGKMLLGFPNYADPSVSYVPALSGGAWAAGLPLTNLQERELHVVARSSDALAASTKIRADLGVARSVGVLSLIGHNLTAAATVQWKGGTTPGATDVYNPGALPMTFAAVTAEDREGINFPVITIPPAAQTARYWDCDIVDTANPDGYVQIGRLWIAGAYKPTTNMAVGAALGLESDTERKVTDGGASVINAKPVRRVARFLLPRLEVSEAFASPWKIQRRAGMAGQVLFVFDDADTTLMHERSFLGVLRELGPLEWVVPDRTAVAFEIVEEL